MPVETELYDLLGVSPSATEDEIKKAYRKKAREHHPDQNPDDPSAHQRFQEMASAYEILSTSDTREVYDMYGMEGMSRGGGGGGPDFGGMGGMDPADIFAELFGASMGGFGFDHGPSRGPRRSKGQDSNIPYEVTLEDLYNGKTVKMNMEKEVVCGICKGSGAKGSAKPKPCVKCEGKGWTTVTTALGPSRLGTHRAMCSECEGHGEKLREKDRCKKCKGNKTVKDKTRQEIYIERGMADRQRVVLAGGGDEEPGIPPGDVIFTLKTRPHESFERSGNDLLTTVHITLSEALLGFSRILITHLDGRGVHVSSPAGKIIKPGDSIILRGEGMPIYKNPDQKGNLYVMLEIDMPEESWLKTIDTKALAGLLPPKKPEMDPKPAVVDEVPFEESDIVDVRATPFNASSSFFDHASGFQFGGDEEDWEDDEDDDDGAEPECRPQ
ncbi:DnaJ-domain-containing protein [Trametes versicolor FP-101664 SS1]|uniref:DnaJ-domain-containing protein n=1 Tax=Trametes versicolor (strain FP-101664) TaxID=717944 RepID=UPI0004622CE6|nr:DnaJ-domain-containing protein [Trametes versicolor FP-101664 SS1]EIW57392.1 DnaJ-domain-containing protein [Trametes versicolor FP-101664 SS1]